MIIVTKKQATAETVIPAKPCTPVMEIWMWLIYAACFHPLFPALRAILQSTVASPTAIGT